MAVAKEAGSGAPLVRKPVDALPGQQQQAVLVVVNLLQVVTNSSLLVKQGA